MTILQSIILGIVQGLTEFLPISSSAHLVLIPHLLGWNIAEAQVFPFGVLVQLGTLVAVILYFWSDLWKIIKAFIRGLVNRKPFEDPDARLGWYLILASVPAMFAGLLLKDKVEAVFNDPNATAYFLFGTAALLILAETISKRTRSMGEMKWFDALWIGLFQAISIFPGVSRSGSTIVGGMTRNLDRPSAARFSFLMSIPVMLGAGLISTLDALKMPGLGSFLPIILVGFVAALLVGYLSIHWLLGFLAKRSFYVFAIYCVLFGALALILGSTSGNVKASDPLPTDAPIVQSTLSLPNEDESFDQNPLTVAYTSSLEWLLPVMSTCAQTVGDFSIITHTVPADQLAESDALIKLRWGAPPTLSTYSTVLGTDRMALIVHPQNPLVALTPELTRSIASAQVTSWGKAAEQCQECFAGSLSESLSTDSPALYFYTSEEETQELFVETIMAGSPVAMGSALLVPGGRQMVESVAGNPTAYGFIPARFLNESVKEIPLSGFDPSALQMPILSISDSEPGGKTRDWLLCLQSVINP